MSFTLIQQATPRLHRSELAVPGSNPSLFEKAAKGAADIIFLDLEDAVAPDDKEQARKNIIQGLNDLDWGTKTMMIRINEHEPISRYFSSKDRPRGAAAFDEIPHGFAVTGAPIIEGAAGFLDCRLHATHEAGDHLIFIGEVVALGHSTGAKPLLFHGGRYCFVRDD